MWLGTYVRVQGQEPHALQAIYCGNFQKCVKQEENELLCVRHPALTTVNVQTVFCHLSPPPPSPLGLFLKQIPGVISFHQQIFQCFLQERTPLKKHITTILLAYLKILTVVL